MKKLLMLGGSLLSGFSIAAMPVNQPIGSSFTLGSAPNKRALSTSLSNPAAPFLMVNGQAEDSFRFGIVGPLGIGIEMGDISDFSDQVDELNDIVTDTYSTLTALNAGLADAQDVLDEIGDTAYVKTSISLQAPFMPIIYKTKSSGAITLDSSVSVLGKGSLLAGTITANTTSLLLETDTSFYAQAATDLSIGLGYSQAVWESSHGMFVSGVKANFHQLTLGRALVELDDDDTDDALSDAFDETVSSSGIGVDLGAVWVSHYYQVGITFANLNEPEFDGMSITSNTVSDEYGISTEGSYTMEMQTTVDFAISTREEQITLGMSYDLNSVEDVVGDDYQWFAASLSYYGDTHLLPALRVGLRQNMAGSELSYASAGLTLLKRLDLDLAVALETVEDSDGVALPRSFYLSLGYSTAF